MYRISHPDHGSMHVYSASDLEVHEALGWSLDKPPVAVVEAVEVIIEAVIKEAPKVEVKAPTLSRKK